jgi:hypothetical protein
LKPASRRGRCGTSRDLRPGGGNATPAEATACGSSRSPRQGYRDRRSAAFRAGASMRRCPFDGRP